MKVYKPALALLAALLVFSGCSAGSSSSSVSPSPSAAETSPSSGASGSGESSSDAAPDFTVTLTDGSTFTLSEHRGTPVFLNFWATWCPYCVQEMPEMQQLYDSYGQKAIIIAVNVAEDADTVSAFVQKNGYAFPVGIDEKGDISALYGVTGLPTTFFIDADGNVAYYEPQAMDYDTMDRGLQGVLPDESCATSSFG